MHTFITAEIGINHNGDLNLAKKLIDSAVVAGCDAVKFQKRTVDKVYTQEYLSQSRTSPWGNTQRAQKEGLEFGKKNMMKLMHTVVKRVSNGMHLHGILIHKIFTAV